MKDIKIKTKKLTKVKCVTIQEILKTQNEKLRFIEELTKEYSNNNDLGRNLRIFINATTINL